MARQIQGKLKGLEMDQFKKQPIIMDPEKNDGKEKKPNSDDAGSEEGKKETTEGEPKPA